MNDNSYYSIHSRHYDSFEPGVGHEVEFYTHEAKEAGSPVLELGCGTGRILIPVARQGVHVVGIENAPTMLALAKNKVSRLSPTEQGHIELHEGDMRDFTLDNRFTLAMIPYRAFQHLKTAEEQRRTLGCIREHLVDGGLLVFNIFDPRPDYLAAHMGGDIVRKGYEFRDPGTGHLFIVWIQNRVEVEDQNFIERRIFEEFDNVGRMVSRSLSELTFRYSFRYEVQHLLELSGFRIEALHGDFMRGAYGSGGEQIWVARKG